jgi:hypothetical protein
MRSRALLVVVIVGIAMGVACQFTYLAVYRANRPSAEVEAVVSACNDAIDAGRLETVWDSLDSETRDVFVRCHALLVDNARDLDEKRERSGPGTVAVRVAEKLEQTHGMSLAAIMASTPQSMWRHDIELRLGPPERRPSFAKGTMNWFDQSDDAAAVRLRLGNGRMQGYRLVHRSDGWKLVDYQPYWDVNRWRSIAQVAQSAK